MAVADQRAALVRDLQDAADHVERVAETWSRTQAGLRVGRAACLEAAAILHSAAEEVENDG